MANITPVHTVEDGGTHRYVWETVTSADTALAVKIPGASDKSIQVTGDFGTNASVAIQGSNDAAGTTFAPLNTPDMIVIAITAAAIVQVLENTVWIRPVVTAGTAEDLDIILLARTTR